MYVPLNARVSGNLDLEFHNLQIFDRFCGFFYQNCEILNLNNRRLGRLKAHVKHITKKPCTDRENPTKKKI